MTSSSSTVVVIPYEHCFICNSRTTKRQKCSHCNTRQASCASCGAIPRECAQCRNVCLPEDIATDTDLRSSSYSQSNSEQSSCHTSEALPTTSAIENDGTPLALLASRHRVNELEREIAQSQARIAHLEHVVAHLQTPTSSLRECTRFDNDSSSRRGSSLKSLSDRGDLCVPLVMVVEHGETRDLRTCVLCDDDPTKGLFTHSWNLVGSILGCKSTLVEKELQDNVVQCQLHEAGERWYDQYVLSITYSGVNALGAGRNTKQCQRAARLALAASVYADLHNMASCDIPDPTNDHAFETLVELVRCARLSSHPQRDFTD